MGTRRILPLVAAGLFLAVAAHAADEFTGQGPLPVRNFQPIQLIFLNLPFERARTLGPGQLALHLESAESNEIATHQGTLQGLLKFETNRTVLGGTAGLAPGWEVGLDVPMISRFGGFLDPFINAIEGTFGTSNVERHFFPNNTFGGFDVYRGDTLLFHGPKEQFALGDISMSTKYELFEHAGWPLLSVRGALKLPTGRADAVFGSGKADVGIGVAAEQQFFRWLVAYGNANIIYPSGPITPGRLTLNPILTEGLAAEGSIGYGVSVLLQQETYTSPMHGNEARLLDGNVSELTVGFNWACASWLIQLAAIDNITPVEAAADFSILLRMTWTSGVLW